MLQEAVTTANGTTTTGDTLVSKEGIAYNESSIEDETSIEDEINKAYTEYIRMMVDLDYARESGFTSDVRDTDIFDSDDAGYAGEKVSEGAGKAAWKQGTPMSEVSHTISPNAKTHLIAESKDISGKKGVVGTHNEVEFYKKLQSTGKDMSKMVSPENVVCDNDFPGLKNIKYDITKGDGKGGFLDEYKPIKDPKTVYDPAIYSDEQMYQWGMEAMKNGYLDGYLICGEASNGMKFMGYYRNGEITNFHPVTSFD